MPRIKLASLYVADQEQALQFYTRRLGFIVRTDEQFGESRWLSVVSDEDLDGAELLLEPTENSAARRLQRSLYSHEIPATMLIVDDLDYEYERLLDLGVSFAGEPFESGPYRSVLLDDTCGNWIQLSEGHS